MTEDRAMVAFGRFPCCDAVRPLEIPADRHVHVNENCPACGTRISRGFNGTVHVIRLREPSRASKNDTWPVFKTGHVAVKAEHASAA